jgi:hypothetical protein
MLSFPRLLGDRLLDPRSRTILFVLVVLATALLKPADRAYCAGGVGIPYDPCERDGGQICQLCLEWPPICCEPCPQRK